MRINPVDKNQFVVGGNEYEPSIWNLETKQSIWKAKTVIILSFFYFFIYF